MIALMAPGDYGPTPSTNARDGSVALSVGLFFLLALAATAIVARIVRSWRARREDETGEPVEKPIAIAPEPSLPALVHDPEPSANRRRCAVGTCGDDATHPRPRVEYSVAASRWKTAPLELCATHARRAAARVAAFDAEFLEKLAAEDGARMQRTRRASMPPNVRTVKGGRAS